MSAGHSSLHQTHRDHTHGTNWHLSGQARMKTNDQESKKESSLSRQHGRKTPQRGSIAASCDMGRTLQAMKRIMVRARTGMLRV